MSCTECRGKFCRKDGRDCYGVKPASLHVYGQEPGRQGALAASSLVDGGRAGTLDRLEEVIEYCRTMGYRRIGVAYCFGMPEHAVRLEQRLKADGMVPVMVQCSVGGVREREIDTTKSTQSVSCNPAGQALALQKLGAEFVIELGLCMGHDVILHQTLQLPFTTLIVKDRVHGHNPARALGNSVDPLARFLADMDDTFRMISDQQLLAWIDDAEQERPLVLDVRSEQAWRAQRIPGSLNVPLRTLPDRFRPLLPDRARRIVSVCQGSVQSAYAVAFLYERGYSNVFNLSGGFSRWQSQGKPVEAGS